jgi:hypothetical protein
MSMTPTVRDIAPLERDRWSASMRRHHACNVTA